MKIILFIALIGLATWTLSDRNVAPPPSVVSSAPSVEQLKPLAALLTNRVVVVDAVTISIAGYLGDLRAAVVVRGDAMITVDLTQARIEEVNHDARRAVIVLPSPHVESARVDHEGTRIVSVESSGLWTFISSDDGRAEVIDQAMRHAQQAVFKAAGEPAVLAEARTRAEMLIQSFFASSLEWSVTVRWADLPDAR